MLHTMTEYILFLLDTLLLRCDTTVGLFYKGLLRSIKSSEDATISSDKDEKAERKDALKKLHVLVDLTYVILSQRASSLMICRANSNVPLSEMYFKKIRYNAVSYLPKDFKLKLKPMTITTVSELPIEMKPKKRTSEHSGGGDDDECSTKKKTKQNIEEENHSSKNSIRRRGEEEKNFL